MVEAEPQEKPERFMSGFAGLWSQKQREDREWSRQAWSRPRARRADEARPLPVTTVALCALTRTRDAHPACCKSL